MSVWRLELYRLPSGRSPVEEYFDRLSDAEMERVDRKLRLLEALGPGIGPPHVDHLRGKIWELRVTGRTQHRVLYAAIDRDQIVLLHGFTKKRQKTPKREIDLAEARYNDYLERREHT